jgi:hypothetical protein
MISSEDSGLTQDLGLEFIDPDVWSNAPTLVADEFLHPFIKAVCSKNRNV